MKIKVATSFSFRSDSRDGNERYISSAVTIEPDDDLSTSALELPNGMEAVYGIDLNEKSQPSTKPQEPQTTSQDYSLQAPRFMVLGKPCTGKTTLARQLCDQFGCELVNATELIEENLRNGTEIGQLIRSIMTDGRDLDDGIVVKMIEQKLKSPACIKNGYVLDGIPTHSEHTFSIQKQLDFIFGLENPPNYLFDIQISNEQLRNRWEDMRIDYKDGRLYPRETYNQEPKITPIQSDFPQLDAETKERLLTRHEELAENLDLHFAFYDSQVQDKLDDFKSKYNPSSIINVDGHVSPSARLEVQDKLDDFKSKYNPSSIINVDGHVSPSARLESTLQKLKSISTTQSCEASDLPSRTPPKNTDRIQITTPQAFKADKNLWIGHAPRLVFFGKPGVGRTTLVKSLCEMWQCQYVNGKLALFCFNHKTIFILATELILKHINEQTPKGLQIASILSQGEDLTDEFVIDLLNDRLGSSDCRQHGYIIDGLPTYTDDTSSVQRQIEFLEQLYPEPYFWVIIDISDDLLRKRWDSSRADRSSSPPSGSVRYSTQEFPSLDEKTKNRLLARHDVLPENLEAYLQFYNQYVEAPLNEFLGRCHPKTVIRFDGSNGLNEMGALLISSIRAIIDSCGLKSSSPRPKNSAPNLTLPLDQHVDPDLLSAGLIVDSVGSFDYLETPRSAQLE
ncbi:hypothetical protein FGIG_07830 [Fasciola gigantica]|uniref:Adenylate kinase n=1 Tax=Fasciola gigantica TaxID=46835 RepID=A0A504YND5_FASGI|nr:hypothetical protein FGIG_07830 [Fasciola gigantica]